MSYKREYELAILDATRYSGNKEPLIKKLSASSFGGDTYRIWLNYKYGNQDDQQLIEANTFGSLLQLGIDNALDRDVVLKWVDGEYYKPSSQYVLAKRLEYEFMGWTISGEIDVLDIKNRIIIDNKVTTSYGIDGCKKEGKMSQYAIQLAIYKWLIWKVEGIEIEDCQLAFFNKLATKAGKVLREFFEWFSPPIMSFEELEAFMARKIDVLNNCLEFETEPPKCDDVFKFGKIAKVGTPKRCVHYCSLNKVCAYYDNSRDLNAKLGL